MVKVYGTWLADYYLQMDFEEAGTIACSSRVQRGRGGCTHYHVQQRGGGHGTDSVLSGAATGDEDAWREATGRSECKHFACEDDVL